MGKETTVYSVGVDKDGKIDLALIYKNGDAMEEIAYIKLEKPAVKTLIEELLKVF